MLDSPDGTKVLLDASSGNSVFRNSASVGMAPEQFRHVLLSHDHADHMLGLPLIQLVYSRANPEGPPLEVHSGPSTLENVRLLCRVSTPELSISAEGATNRRGQKVYQWHPSVAGQSAQLGPNTKAACFPVDHIPGSIGWRVDCDGIPVVFSGDTVFSPTLVEAARGARVLIHEAFGPKRTGSGRMKRPIPWPGRWEGRQPGRGRGADPDHLTGRYHENPQPLLDEVRRYYNGPVSVAHDLYQVEIS